MLRSTYFKLYTTLETLNHWQNKAVKHVHEGTEKRKNKFRYIHCRGEGERELTYRINLQSVTNLKRGRSEQPQGWLVKMWMTTVSIKCTLIVSHLFEHYEKPSSYLLFPAGAHASFSHHVRFPVILGVCCVTLAKKFTTANKFNDILVCYSFEPSLPLSSHHLP